MLGRTVFISLHTAGYLDIRQTYMHIYRALVKLDLFLFLCFNRVYFVSVFFVCTHQHLIPTGINTWHALMLLIPTGINILITQHAHMLPIYLLNVYSFGNLRARVRRLLIALLKRLYTTI